MFQVYYLSFKLIHWQKPSAEQERAAASAPEANWESSSSEEDDDDDADDAESDGSDAEI